MHLRRAYLSMHRKANSNFARHGLTADQYVALTALANAGPMTQQELARRCHCDPNTLRAILGRLEGHGLVARQPHSTDGRARAVSLTKRGASTQRSLWESNVTFQRELEGLFGPEELETFLGYLGRITRAMGPAPGRAPGAARPS
ncbi:MAG: MarR family transcriptional regulator [Isosphaeraceae bacterium]